MALEKVPQLTTVIPVDAVSNMGRQSMRNAGAFEMRFWNWIMLNAGKGSNAALDPATQAELKEMADHRWDYLSLLPLRPGSTPLKLAPEYEDWLIQAMRHGKDDAFWAQNNILADPSRYKDMPVYLVGGWYDSWAGNTAANFTALSKTLIARATAFWSAPALWSFSRAEGHSKAPEAGALQDAAATSFSQSLS